MPGSNGRETPAMRVSTMRADHAARTEPPREAVRTAGRFPPGVAVAGPARWVPLAVVLAALALGYAFGLHEMLTLESLARNRGRLEALVAEHTTLAIAAYVGV